MESYRKRFVIRLLTSLAVSTLVLALIVSICNVRKRSWHSKRGEKKQGK